MQVVIFSSPGREEMIDRLISELGRNFCWAHNDYAIIDEPETFGKEKFWCRYQQAFDICLNSEFDDFLFLPDDINEIDFDTVNDLFSRFKEKKFVCSIIGDGRTSCWGSVPNPTNHFKMNDYFFRDLGFYDCGGLTNRTTISGMSIDPIGKQWFDRPGKSSGVGAQLTRKFREAGVPMFHTSPSLSFHGDHKSIMHPKERKRKPLYAIPKRLKVVVGIATFKGREEYLQRTIESLHTQADEIIVYNNELNPDITDNGKFYGLTQQEEPVYYITCDDDLIYPPSYIEDMIQAIEKYKCIVTHHGRKLIGTNRSYYRGHLSFRCLDHITNDQQIDVAGTGVSGFRSDYFNPAESIINSEHHKMSDVLFSLEAAKQGKKIMVLNHKKGYIKYQDVPVEQTIYGTERNREEVQIQLANEIYKLQYRNE